MRLALRHATLQLSRQLSSCTASPASWQAFPPAHLHRGAALPLCCPARVDEHGLEAAAAAAGAAAAGGAARQQATPSRPRRCCERVHGAGQVGHGGGKRMPPLLCSCLQRTPTPLLPPIALPACTRAALPQTWAPRGRCTPASPLCPWPARPSRIALSSAGGTGTAGCGRDAPWDMPALAHVAAAGRRSSPPMQGLPASTQAAHEPCRGAARTCHGPLAAQVRRHVGLHGAAPGRRDGRGEARAADRFRRALASARQHLAPHQRLRGAGCGNNYSAASAHGATPLPHPASGCLGLPQAALQPPPAALSRYQPPHAPV